MQFFLLDQTLFKFDPSIESKLFSLDKILPLNKSNNCKTNIKEHSNNCKTNIKYGPDARAPQILIRLSKPRENQKSKKTQLSGEVLVSGPKIFFGFPRVFCFFWFRCRFLKPQKNIFFSGFMKNSSLKYIRQTYQKTEVLLGFGQIFKKPFKNQKSKGFFGFRS